MIRKRLPLTLFALILIAGFFAACKKTAPSNTWTVDSMGFTSGSTEYIKNTYNQQWAEHYYLEGDDRPNYAFVTVILPNTSGNPATGSCSIIAADTLVNPAGQQVTIIAGYKINGILQPFASDGNTSDKAEIYMYNGKVCCRGKGIHMHRRDDPTRHTTLDFDIMETTR